MSGKVKATGKVLGKKSQTSPGTRLRKGYRTRSEEACYVGSVYPMSSHMLNQLSPGHTFFRDGICSLFGFVLQVIHHVVHLRLVLQEERTDDARVEQVRSVGRAGSHAPQQEAALHRGEAAW